MIPDRPVPLVNLPNILTVSRILLVPIGLIFLFQGDGHEPWWRVAAWTIFAIAAITDRYDGHIARKRGLITNFGKIADPIADKALTGAALVSLSILGDIYWWVTIVILSREIGITLLRLALLRYEVIAASAGGKLKTFVQICAIGLYVLPFPGFLEWFRFGFMALALLLTVGTGLDYIVKAVKIVASGRKRATNKTNSTESA
ncbi:CDP-diacylglycerol--glycerol-3-phosphate 3-phosphatidyltransferase [Nakamurella antarctica]|uniref:CDP-diacylglycerol--glycerol-3-phosphate 3-phosphatidyltransferase n=1 Tax=Nakamurella antarctica TaxID=1902245 RepID=A0A3G8ZMC9_9ACTN|nr:CDP-diacylglycerol--glycerol-3-phosphate 3-phosphatidyltransferase [Nakamurella antarctica]AZI57947.1 CDP-diacylglycerol--glycerol-3-phosphate 3-phosphatidyltransferase [Nakamurella antarctica]